MLQIALPILDDKAMPNFYNNFYELTDLKKTHSTNLEQCFTASITAHSISILSEPKMSSFGLYAGSKTRCPSTIIIIIIKFRVRPLR